MCHSNHSNPSRPGKESESRKSCQYLLQLFLDDKTVCGYIVCRIHAINYLFNMDCVPPYLLQPLLHLKEDVVGLTETKRGAPRTVSVEEQT